MNLTVYIKSILEYTQTDIHKKWHYIFNVLYKQLAYL